MKSKPAKTDRQKYNRLSGIGFILARIWEWERGMAIARTLSIPLNVAQSLALIYFPKLFIDMITQKVGVTYMLACIGAVCLTLLACETAKRAVDAKAGGARYAVNFKISILWNRKYMTTDYENTDSPQLETVRQRATDWQTNEACEFFADDAARLLTNLLGSVVYGGMIALVSPWILLLLVASGAINYMALSRLRRYNDRNSKARASVDRKVGYIGGLSAQFEYAKDVRLYNMFGWLDGLMARCQMERLAWDKKVEIRGGMAGSVDVLLRLLRDGAAYAVLISMMLAGRLELGNFVLYLGAITGFSTWLSTIIQDFNDILDKSMRVGYLREYLDMPDKQNHGPGCPLPDKDETPFPIELNNLTYRYPGADKAALDGVDAVIEPGEKIAVVGENGAGKTTFVKNLCGLYRPTSGSITVNGRPSEDYNIDEYYSLFTVVFQDIYMLPIPIVSFVAASTTDTEIDRERARLVLEQSGLWDAVEKLRYGMDTVLMKGVFEESVDLSGGERQKLMLARALYKDAPVLVLDEPTAALDPIAESELYKRYGELAAGKTAFFISHRLASTQFCDRIFFLADGKIAECGSHAELLALDGKYAYMWKIQSHYYKDDPQAKDDPQNIGNRRAIGEGAPA